MINNIDYETYIKLANQLLNCSSEEDASKILNDNKFLINTKLVIVLLQKISGLISQNEQRSAKTLFDISVQLAEILQLPEFILMLYPSELESRRFLLGQLIQATAPGKVNFEIVDSLLYCNLDKLDEEFIKVLKREANIFFSIQPETAQAIASSINNISYHIEQFPSGNRADNLEIAINGYEIAQNVFTYDSFKEEWAKIHNHLGNAYRNRIIGDPKENLERAIDYFKKSLAALDPGIENNQVIWAGSQHNLGLTYLAYRDKYLDRRETDYLTLAIEAFNEALTIYKQSKFHKELSAVQFELGVTYSKYIEIEVEEKAKYLNLALTGFNNALKFFSRQEFPEKWATIQNSIANIYSRTNEIDNLKLALNYYCQVLQVHTRDGFPEYWARTWRNIGHTYWGLKQINEAKGAFKLALSVFTPDDFPWLCLVTATDLGDIALESQQFLEAKDAYDIAIQADERRISDIDLYVRKQEERSNTISVYANAVKASICANLLDQALEYVERSKTRNLVELFLIRDISPKGDIPEMVLDEFRQLCRKIAVEKLRLAMVMGNQESRTLLSLDRTKLNNLQYQLNELIQGEIKSYDPNFSLPQKTEKITFDQIQKLLPNDKTALIEWYILNDKFVTFIVTSHNSQPEIIQFSDEYLKNLSKHTDEYLNLYYNKDDKELWRNQLESRLQNLAQILHIDEIISHIPTECDRLILIPHRFLHFLPLHALPLQNPGQSSEQTTGCLLDKFPGGVSYSPSCHLLQLSQNQQHLDFSHLFAIQNPTNDLRYTNVEVNNISSFFPEIACLKEQAATKAALTNNQNLNQAHCIHFSCHGEFNLMSPLKSGLILANNERLTLPEIFALTLNQCRLVVLSACETGISDITSLSDEYISLPSGFLYAGSPNVVSSLWTINDFSTAFLMIKFYQNLQSQTSVPLALNQAQRWLRDVTKICLEKWIEDHMVLSLDITLKMWLRRRPDRPFQSPVHWAAFCAIGKF